MKERWQQLLTRIDALSLRERMLVLGAALAVLIAVWDVFLLAPLEQRQDVARKEVLQLQSQITDLNGAIAKTVAARTHNPNVEVQQQIDAVQAHIHQLDQKLKAMTADLIGPAEMARVLEKMLAEQKGLRLLSARSLPAKPLLPPTAGAGGKNTAATQPEANVYRHGLRLEVEGSYADTLKYLKALQRLPWQFYWDDLDLEVHKYPTNRVTITVHTLSLREGWIGV